MAELLALFGGFGLGALVAMLCFELGAKVARADQQETNWLRRGDGSPETDMVAERDRLAAIQEGYKHEDNDLDDEE